MAGDWIKIEKITPEKPEIVRMAAILKRDSDEIFGKLFKIWAWADDQSTDGCAMQIDEAFLDKKAGKKGFSKAMRVVGWLEGESGSLTFPGFHRHNGETAKTRAAIKNRVEKHRKCNGESVTPVTVRALGKPLPEKRREDKNTPLPPLRGGEGGGADELISKIKSLRKEWGAVPGLSAREARVFEKNSGLLAMFPGDAWDTIRDFLKTSLPEGSALFQPVLLVKFLENPGGVLGQAKAWKEKQRPSLRVVPKPRVAEGPAATMDEAREILRMKS